MLAKKVSMTLELDGIPRYFIKKKYRGTGTGNGTKKVPRYSTVYQSTVVLPTTGYKLLFLQLVAGFGSFKRVLRLVSTTSVKWIIFSFFIDLSALKI